jgi:hypothetical protein
MRWRAGEGAPTGRVLNEDVFKTRKTRESPVFGAIRRLPHMQKRI